MNLLITHPEPKAAETSRLGVSDAQRAAPPQFRLPQGAFTMFKRPKKPTTVMWLGVAFIALGALALPLGLNDPEGTTRLGIPVLLGAVLLIIAGIYYGALGAYWRMRDKRG